MSDADAQLAAQLRAQQPTSDIPIPSQADIIGQSDAAASGGPSYVPPPPAAPPSLDDLANLAVRLRLLDGTDTSTGAPTSIRLQVGAADLPADRLTQLRKTYPDAVPLPDSGGNFVYTNEGGQRQTYMPMGWRMPTQGDVASVIPEIAGGIGGAAGAIGGSGLGPVGTYVGGGLGATAAQEGTERFLRGYFGIPDTRTPGQQGTDAALATAANTLVPAASEGFGRMLAANWLTGGGVPTATQTAARSLESSGVAPPGFAANLPPSVAAESPGLARIESTVLQTPVTGGLLNRFTGTASGLGTAADTLAQRAAAGGVVPAPDTFANTVGGIANRITTGWNANREAADQALQAAVGPTTLSDLTPVLNLEQNLRSQMANAPATLSDRIQPTLDQIEKIKSDANLYGGGDTLPFSIVRNARTDVGKLLDWQESGAQASTPAENLRQLYGALKETIGDTATAQGPAAEQALADHDAMVSAFNAPGGPKESLATLADPSTRANRVQALMQSTAPEDSTAIATLMSPQYATPAESAQIRSGMLGRLGLNSQNQFDPGTWLTNWNRIPDSNKTAMFGQNPALLDSLNNFATVQNAVRNSASMKGFSNTGAVNAIYAAMAGGVGGLAAGHPGAALVAAATPLVAGIPAGKLLSSPAFTNWMTGTWGVNPAVAGSWAQHLGRLGTVAQIDPSIANEVQQFRGQLPDQLPNQSNQ